MLLTGDGVTHNDLCPHPVYEEDVAVAVIKRDITVVVTAASKVQALWRDVVGRV